LTASNGGTVSISNTNTNLTNFAGSTLTGGTYQALAGSTINFNGRAVTTLAANTAVTLSGAGSVFAAVNGLTTNNGSLTVGSGRTFTVSGGTLINGGTLIVGTTANDNSTLTGNVNVGSGGKVQGTGTIAGAVTLTGTSTLHPGNSPGTLTITGAVTMASGVSYALDLNGALAGTGYSQLNLTGGGSINLNNATLLTSLGYAPAPADSFTIITGGPVTGTFAGLPDGSQVLLGSFGGTDYTRFILYGPTSVVLSPVPPRVVGHGVGDPAEAVPSGNSDRALRVVDDHHGPGVQVLGLLHDFQTHHEAEHLREVQANQKLEDRQMRNAGSICCHRAVWLGSVVSLCVVLPRASPATVAAPRSRSHAKSPSCDRR
jgi:hypothetical protein